MPTGCPRKARTAVVSFRDMSDAPTYDPDQPDQPDQGEPDAGQTSGDPERAQTLEQQKEQARRALEGQGDTEDDDSPA